MSPNSSLAKGVTAKLEFGSTETSLKADFTLISPSWQIEVANCHSKCSPTFHLKSGGERQGRMPCAA
ncbi:MAG: hypothetical protein AAB316_12155 [Bacteroidota bacterium]